MQIIINDPKFKIGQYVKCTNDGYCIYEKAAFTAKVTKLYTANVCFSDVGSGIKECSPKSEWKYTVKTDAGNTYTFAESRLSEITPQDKLAEDLKIKGITVDTDKWIVKAVSESVPTMTYDFGTAQFGWQSSKQDMVITLVKK
jgi:hypothetical protein